MSSVVIILQKHAVGKIPSKIIGSHGFLMLTIDDIFLASFTFKASTKGTPKLITWRILWIFLDPNETKMNFNIGSFGSCNY